VTTPPSTPITRPSAPTHLDRDTFGAYLVRTRWFGGKGRPHRVDDVRVIGEVPGRVTTGPWVVIHLVDVAYDDVDPGAADARETYQVPLALYTDAQNRLDHAFVGWWEDPERGWVHAYDAVHDREAMDCWQRSFDAGASSAELAFVRTADHELDLDAHSTLFSGEQSNSSVAFGEDALLKVFRKVTPGPNPDITVHRLLTEAGSDKIAALYGFVEAPGPPGTKGGSSYDLAMLQQFLRTATDGWDLALSSVRTLLGREDVSVEESGGDFAGEAGRLGEALREVHDLLATTGTTTTPAAALAETMTARLTAAVRAVPELAPHEEALRTVFGRVADLGEITVQRVHGDLHLGQTLRTSAGWKLVDFEGEPAKTLEERIRPDSVWRDVAGMLRSFDYAPRVVHRTQTAGSAPGDDLEDQHLDVRADEWSQRSRAAFVEAYAGGDPSPAHLLLLEAYVADKAVYETVYEARNRPSWVTIPLAAVARIGATT
jgi:maltokinase